jgi:ankyrin repeat protein
LDEFIAAAGRGDSSFITAALAAFPHLARARRIDGVTAAHTAARSGKAAALSLLLDNGADINATDVRGLTILHHAALSKSAAVTQVALTRGAPILARDSAGKIPYEVALLVGATDVSELLRKAKAPRGDGVAASLTACALAAARSGDADLTILLLSGGADVHGADENGFTLLHHAVLAGSEATVRAVLSAGISIGARDKYGETALDVAVKIRANHIATILKEAG